MRRGCLLVLCVVLAACSKSSNETPDETVATGSASDTAASKPSTTDSPKPSGQSAADIMSKSVAEGRAAATTKPGVTPPATPPPVTPPADPLPPEVAKTDPLATTPPPALGSAAAPVTDELKVGDRVMAKWTNGSWYPGKIVAINDGKYDINYDDGDKSRGLPAAKVRKKTSSSSGKVAGKSSSTSNDAPCPGPGITRRCNGKCVNIQEDNNHCGGCNNRCPSGKSCDGHLFCRDADGNL